MPKRKVVAAVSDEEQDFSEEPSAVETDEEEPVSKKKQPKSKVRVLSVVSKRLRRALRQYLATEREGQG
jgi:hypothetical protein